MNIATPLALATALSLALPATAGPFDGAEEEIMVWDGMPLARSCDKNTITINECAYAVWKKADDELNTIYQEQLRYLRSTEAEYPPARGASSRFVAAQRSWLLFRDKDCEYQVGEPGGSGDAFENLKCMYKRTLTRILELREYTACRYNGCPY
jgi:uncharacterized protein YecT (DUF1311 family)